MALDKQGNFSQQPSELPDVPSPSMTPDQIRAKWQTPLDELKATMNNAFDKLNATSNGASGAYNVGATDWDGVTASTVGALLSWLKANKTDLTGDHKGTWQGYTPSKADPGISSVVDQHTSQLADIALHVSKYGVKGDGVVDDTTAFQSAINDGISKKLFVYIPPSYKVRITSKVIASLPTEEDYFGGIICDGTIAGDFTGDYAFELIGKFVEGKFQSRYDIPTLRIDGQYKSKGFHAKHIDHSTWGHILIQKSLGSGVHLEYCREMPVDDVTMVWCKGNGDSLLSFYETDEGAGVNSDSSNGLHFNDLKIVYSSGDYVRFQSGNTKNYLRNLVFNNPFLHYLDYDTADVVRNEADVLVLADSQHSALFKGGLIRKGTNVAGNLTDIEASADVTFKDVSMTGEGTGLTKILSNSIVPVKVDNCDIKPENGYIWRGNTPPLFTPNNDNIIGNSDFSIQEWNTTNPRNVVPISSTVTVQNGNECFVTNTADNGFISLDIFGFNGGHLFAGAEVKTTGQNVNARLIFYDASNAIILDKYSTTHLADGNWIWLGFSEDIPSNAVRAELRFGNQALNGVTYSVRKPVGTFSEYPVSYQMSKYKVLMKPITIASVPANSGATQGVTVGNRIFGATFTPTVNGYATFNIAEADKNKINVTFNAGANPMTNAKGLLFAHYL